MVVQHALQFSGPDYVSTGYFRSLQAVQPPASESTSRSPSPGALWPPARCGVRRRSRAAACGRGPRTRVALRVHEVGAHSRSRSGESARGPWLAANSSGRAVHEVPPSRREDRAGGARPGEIRARCASPRPRSRRARAGARPAARGGCAARQEGAIRRRCAVGVARAERVRDLRDAADPGVVGVERLQLALEPPGSPPTRRAKPARRLGTLGVLAQHQQRAAQARRLFLHAARVRDDRRRWPADGGSRGSERIEQQRARRAAERRLRRRAHRRVRVHREGQRHIRVTLDEAAQHAQVRLHQRAEALAPVRGERHQAQAREAAQLCCQLRRRFALREHLLERVHDRIPGDRNAGFRHAFAAQRAALLLGPRSAATPGAVIRRRFISRDRLRRCRVRRPASRAHRVPCGSRPGPRMAVVVSALAQQLGCLGASRARGPRARAPRPARASVGRITPGRGHRTPSPRRGVQQLPCCDTRRGAATSVAGGLSARSPGELYDLGRVRKQSTLCWRGMVTPSARADPARCAHAVWVCDGRT